jgi:serine/threonine-protein kinase
VLGAVLLVLVGLLFLVTRVYSSDGDEAAKDTSADVTVPRVIGMPQADAQAALGQAHLVATVQSAPDDNVAAGTVVDQSPAANASLAAGDQVVITVSAGPSSITMPDVKGRTVDEAIQALTDLGLVPSPKQVQSDTVPEGAVIDTNPPAGSPTTRGATIEIQVSAKPSATGVPDVTGQPQDQAVAALQGAGFQVAVTEQPSRRRHEGEVLAQNPPPGTPLPAGSQVTIVVGTSRFGDGGPFDGPFGRDDGN